jgi:hypothetical protein
MMRITSVVIYHITQKENIPDIEAAIRAGDEDAYQKHGPYFQHHQGRDYLLCEGDIGYHSDARDYILSLYDPQGGIELSGTSEELSTYEYLLSSEDCYSCALGSSILLLPKQTSLEAFLHWMSVHANAAKTPGVQKKVRLGQYQGQPIVEAFFGPDRGGGMSFPLYLRFALSDPEAATRLALLLHTAELELAPLSQTILDDPSSYSLLWEKTTDQ